MEDLFTAIILQVIGITLLIVEIFIPSYGLLALSGLGCLGTGIWFAFGKSAAAGYISTLIALVLVPSLAIVAIKIWHRTPFGKKISPPNPKLTEADTSVDTARIEPMVGTVRRAMAPLRPIGTCEFDGRRVQCRAEMGMIQKDQPVLAVGVDGPELVVQPHHDDKS